MQAMTPLMKKLIHHQTSTEAEVVDQEGRTYGDKLLLHGIPEKVKESNISAFLVKLLRETLNFTEDDWTQVTEPGETRVRLCSIIAKLASYTEKESRSDPHSLAEESSAL